MEKTKDNSYFIGLMKFIIFTVLGTVLVLIPFSFDGSVDTILFHYLKIFVKTFNGPLTAIMVAFIVLSALLSVIDQVKSDTIIRKQRLLKKLFSTSLFYTINRVIGAIIALMVYFKVGPAFITSPDTGGTMLSLATQLSVLVPMMLLFQTFILEFGAMEFLGEIVGGIVKPIFKVSEICAVNIISAWVGPGNVAIMATEEFFQKGYFTVREMAVIGSVKIEGTNLLVRGWHIADAAANRKYAYIILFDKSANRELRRIAYNPTNRSDVARVYHNVYNGANGGFDVSFDLRGLDFAGHQLQIVARYTDDVAGNGNAMDVWSGDYTFNSNAGYLDSVKKVNDKTINVSGWHVADAASRQKYTWIIVLDKTLGREIARTKYVQSTRNDVYTCYSGSYNARQSGFSNVNVQLSTNLSGLNNHVFQVVARYSDNSYSGEGHYTDFYSKDVR